MLIGEENNVWKNSTFSIENACSLERKSKLKIVREQLVCYIVYSTGWQLSVSRPPLFPLGGLRRSHLCVIVHYYNCNSALLHIDTLCSTVHGTVMQNSL